MQRHPWIFVLLAFALLISGWATIIFLANKHRPEQVPLEHKSMGAPTDQGSVDVPPDPQPQPNPNPNS